MSKTKNRFLHKIKITKKTLSGKKWAKLHFLNEVLYFSNLEPEFNQKVAEGKTQTIIAIIILVKKKVFKPQKKIIKRILE